MSHSFFNLGWNGFGSNLTGWVGIGAENLPREDLYLLVIKLRVASLALRSPLQSRPQLTQFHPNEQHNTSPITRYFIHNTYNEH